MNRIREARLAFWFMLAFVIVFWIGQACAADTVLQYAFVYTTNPPVAGKQVSVYQGYTFNADKTRVEFNNVSEVTLPPTTDGSVATFALLETMKSATDGHCYQVIQQRWTGFPLSPALAAKVNQKEAASYGVIDCPCTKDTYTPYFYQGNVSSTIEGSKPCVEGCVTTVKCQYYPIANPGGTDDLSYTICRQSPTGEFCEANANTMPPSDPPKQCQDPSQSCTDSCHPNPVKTMATCTQGEFGPVYTPCECDSPKCEDRKSQCDTQCGGASLVKAYPVCTIVGNTTSYTACECNNNNGTGTDPGGTGTDPGGTGTNPGGTGTNPGGTGTDPGGTGTNPGGTGTDPGGTGTDPGGTGTDPGGTGTDPGGTGTDPNGQDWGDIPKGIGDEWKKEDVAIHWDELKTSFGRIGDKFPLNALKNVKNAFDDLKNDSTDCPGWDLQFPSGFGQTTTVHVDLCKWNDIATMIKSIFAFFIVVLGIFSAIKMFTKISI